jgi:uncharacterized protein YxjI
MSNPPETLAQTTNAARSIFKESEYVLQKKIVALPTTFEIMNSSGVLIARGEKEFAGLGSAYVLETAEGDRIGELRGSLALIPNRPFMHIMDANGQEIAIIMMRVAKKPGAGFLSVGVTTWVIAAPSGDELAKINWSKLGGHDWKIETPDGTMVAEVHWNWSEVPRDKYQVKIHNPAIDPYFVLATVFANPADRTNLG